MPLGDLEQVVLFAVLRLDGETHGAAIVQEIADRTGRSVSPGALYTVLERLEVKGFVESWIGDSTPDRGGRRRKVYRLLPGGARELSDWYSGIQEMASGTRGELDRLAGGGATS
jgi:PadR family transcriptional regulator